MNLLINLDQELFYWINHWPHFPVTDFFAVFLSGIGSFAAVWLVLGLIILIREERKDHWFIIRASFAAFFSYATTQFWLKPFIDRPRPQLLDNVHLVTGYVITGQSFPSGHATAAFSLAYILSRKELGWRPILYLLAVLISLSRIYLGYHYPFDVIAGAVWGTLIGILIDNIRWLSRKPFKRKKLV